MQRPYRQIDLDRDGDEYCAHLRQRNMDENNIHLLGDELTRIIDEEGCRKLILVLGRDALQCLYSVFLAKLVMVQRRLHDHKGALVLCEAPPEVMMIFDACRLRDYFEFAPDRAAALAALAQKDIS